MKPSWLGQWLWQRHTLLHSQQCGVLTQLQGMENYILLPIKHLQARRHCTVSMLSLEILMIVSFNSLLRISCKRSHSANYLHPLATPLLMTGHIHWAVESLRKMTGRSPFQEGEGGEGGPQQNIRS